MDKQALKSLFEIIVEYMDGEIRTHHDVVSYGCYLRGIPVLRIRQDDNGEIEQYIPLFNVRAIQTALEGQLDGR